MMADRPNDDGAMPFLENIDPIGALLSAINVVQGASGSQQSSSSEAKGTWGTCTWEIDADGVLTVHPGKGGEASNSFGVAGYWFRWRDNVRKVVFAVEDGNRVVAPQNCTGLFGGMANLEVLDVSEGDFSKVSDMSALLHSCTALKSVDLSGVDVSKVTNMRALFNGCTSLKTVNLSGADASKVTDVSAMFNGCTSLESVDMSNLDISSVVDLSAMFNCADTYLNPSSLLRADLSGLIAPSVKTMSAMFRSCDSLESVNLSGIKAPKLEDMSAMFYDCRSLTDVNLSGLDTSSVKNMEALFYGCSSLAFVDLSGFDTSNVTSMRNMFKWCMSLKELDASGFDTSKIAKAEHVSYMFKGCTSLERVAFGAKTNPFGVLPDNEVRGHADWLSDKERTWLTAREIAGSRLGVPDTYTRC